MVRIMPNQQDLLQDRSAGWAEVRFLYSESARRAALLDGAFSESSCIQISLDYASRDESKILVNGFPKVGGWKEVRDYFAPCGSVAFVALFPAVSSVASRPQAHSTVPKAPPHSQEWAGDWNCFMCGDLQFGRNSSCRCCGTTKPDKTGGIKM